MEPYRWARLVDNKMHRSLPREHHRTEGSCRNVRRIDFPHTITSIQPAAHLAAEEVRSSSTQSAVPSLCHLPPAFALCAIELLHFGTSSGLFLLSFLSSRERDWDPSEPRSPIPSPNIFSVVPTPKFPSFLDSDSSPTRIRAELRPR